MNNVRKNVWKLVIAGMPLLLAACAIGPDYKKAPDVDIGTSYKAAAAYDAQFPQKPTVAQYQAAANQAWVQANVDDLSKGDWWLRFEDAQLNQLMNELNTSNLEIEQALARYDAAVASLRSSQASLFPTLAGSASSTRSGGDEQQVGNAYKATASLSWELDLWGKIRRQVQASKAQAQASAADWANVRLSMQAQLAKAYFGLRMIDEQIKLLNQIVASDEQAVAMNQRRYNQGVAARADVVSAMTQLESARAQAINIQSTRQQYESAIAVLLGKAPSQFVLVAQPFVAHIPTIPTVLPSVLLTRRADIYSAERAVAAANEQIGIAQAAWLPSLSLSASSGWQASSWSDWFAAPLNVWSLGPQLALSLFDGGARSAALASSKAQYREQVAAYRQTVLTALKEVEDNMTLVSTLAQQYEVQQRALSAARESLTITRNQYQAGMVNYLSVIQVENTTYNTEISTLQLINQRLSAAIDLVVALGGGWSAPIEGK
ncbi:efflux transporter outer membrane subunit [Pelistega europaea]|uniref:Efflux transporter outer membrane subunit n=1 Tax=Pelistega europaea TaxID=106147 RepID=A0A7Y4LB97_9BURK|nr:efflux transporter outer membrane subunit [Pelistega europaea]NOL50395.1 efflux transporter outer membrane subunit [Pelistega europaea]